MSQITNTCSTCPANWVVYDNHCYRKVSAYTTWTNADIACKSTANASLIIVYDQNEFHMLSSN